MIDVLLYHQLGYRCCTGVPQARVLSPSFLARANRSRRHRFSGRDSFPLCGFEGHLLNLVRRPSVDEYGNTLNSEWNSGHSWADCGYIDWEFV